MTPELFGSLFKVQHYTITVNTEGISEEESRRQPGPGMNSLNWVVGHVLDSRNAILALLGAPPVFATSENAVYKRGGNGEMPTGRGHTLAELLGLLEKSQEALGAALRATTDQALAAPCTLPGYERLPGGDSVAAKIGFLQFHEGYHCGQVGLLRRLLGKEGQIR